MKKTSILILLSLALAGCNNSTQTQQNTTQVSQTNSVNQTVQKSDDSLTVSSHSTQKNTTQSQTNSSNSATSGGGSPMQKSVDVTQMTADIEKADKEYKAKPTDEKAKSELAEAYFRRAFALTDAAQYRAALGDFRKGLKLKPDAKEAKAMHDQIIDIFKSIGREPPKEGEEPAPLPITK
jgi:tetratricopeptide (TPR) repeat protein